MLVVGELEGRDEISRRDFLTDRLSTEWGRAVTEFFRALILNLHIPMLVNTREFFNFDIKALTSVSTTVGCEKEESLKKQ